MIRINNKKYYNYDIEITWGNFKTIVCGQETCGIAPIIRFNLENNVFIEIESVFLKEKVENSYLNEKINIERYITDVIYKDDKGWVSIITGKYSCSIIRVDEKRFKLEFFIESKEIEPINIIINTNVELL